jgi:nucleoside-diphosphate-sugar epimerase
MKILMTGNLGYIGSVASEFLIAKGYELEGLDIGYYRDCILDQMANDVKTTFLDVRDVEERHLLGFDAVIHLAALSNDPIGELDSNLTLEINYEASVRIAKLAKSAGVKRFIFVSTQSIYGISGSEIELDEDSSSKNPQTAYAESKWLAEQEIMKLAEQDFVVVALRPSTVFGWSPRLRTDIVFNNLLAHGFYKKKIEVHSDGTPWRPIVHVRDVASVIEICLTASTSKVNGEAFNVGVTGGNHTVREIAQSAAGLLDLDNLIFNTEKISDPRSYRVSFAKAKMVLDFEANIGLEEGGLEILSHLTSSGLPQELLLGRYTTRLAQIKYLLSSNTIDSSLRFR